MVTSSFKSNNKLVSIKLFAFYYYPLTRICELNDFS